MRSCEYFDAHNHIENYGTYEKIPALFSENGNEKIGVLMMAMDMDTFDSAKKIEAVCNNAIACFGIHPWNAHLFTDKIDMFEDYVKRAHIVGEIGLDALWSKEQYRHLQYDVFSAQIELAKKYNKPVSLHTVKKEEECLTTLKSAKLEKVCVHWFHGDTAMAKKYLDLGCFFSLGPDVGFSSDADEIAKYIPLDRLLVETDGADCFSWGRKCEKSPWHYEPKAILDIYSHIANVRGISLDILASKVKENFFNFTRL